MSSRAGVESLLYLMDFGFEGNPEHSILGNLQDVRENDWEWRAPGSGRSIKDLALHAITAKYVYANHAFGDATISWNAGTRPNRRGSGLSLGRARVVAAHPRSTAKRSRLAGRRGA